MAQPYLDQFRKLVAAIEPNNHNLVCKHFFSGAALYLEHIICASLTPKGLAFKLPKSRCDELIAQGKAIPLRYFDNSPIKQGYILLPDFRDLSDAEISPYLEECLTYVASAGCARVRLSWL